MTAALPTMGFAGLPVFPRVRGSRQRIAWLTRRADGLGSSDLAAVLQISTYQSPFSLWWSKREAWADDDQQTEEQYWGLKSEEMVAQRYAEDHRGLTIVKPPASLYQHPTVWWALCSPDRFAIDKATGEVEPLELKTDMNYGRWTDDEYPEVYRVQLGWQCYVLGCTRGRLTAKVGARTFHYVTEFEPDEFERWRDAGERFWASVMAGEAPELDDHEATTAALRKAYGLVDDAPPVIVDDLARQQYLAAYAAFQGAKKRFTLAQNQMRARLGESKRAVGSDGATFLTRSVSERQGYVVKPSTVDKLITKPPKTKETDDND